MSRIDPRDAPSNIDPTIDPSGGPPEFENDPDDDLGEYAQSRSTEELNRLAGLDGPDMPGHYLDELSDPDE